VECGRIQEIFGQMYQGKLSSCYCEDGKVVELMGDIKVIVCRKKGSQFFDDKLKRVLTHDEVMELKKNYE